MIAYKFTREDGSPSHNGSGKWSLPRGKRPGAWRTVEGEIRPCSNGLHLCRPEDLLSWASDALWEAEHQGPVVVQADKIVVGKARLTRRVEAWNEKTARLLAVHFAARVLPLYEKQGPGDRRVRDCLLAAHGFALGTITKKALDTAWAAGDAARAAAWAAGDAARAAAGDAARAAAWAAWAAGDAAGDAARAAAGDAARAAAWAAAGDAARAARAAAWAAGDAAGDAEYAAWAAERKWQQRLLMRALKDPKFLERLPKELR